MKLILRWFLTTILFLTTWLPFYILGYFITWFPLLFTNKNSEHMPFFGWPWDNVWGINGTLSMKNLKWVYTCNKKEIDAKVASDNVNIWEECQRIVQAKTGNERSYKNRWIWVTFRNPVSNISLYLLGVVVNGEVVTKNWKFLNTTIQRDELGWKWLYTINFHWTKTKCFQHMFGWKVTDPTAGNGIKTVFMYRISPWRTV